MTLGIRKVREWEEGSGLTGRFKHRCFYTMIIFEITELIKFAITLVYDRFDELLGSNQCVGIGLCELNF